MKGDFHVRFCENLRVKLPWVTRLPASHPATWTETVKSIKILQKDIF